MRAFVAVWPSPAVARQLTAIDRPARPGVRWTTEGQWHVTLRFLGPLGADEVEGVKARLEPLGRQGGTGPVTAVAGPAWEQLGSSILCLPVGGLDELAALVVALTADIGAPVGDRGFRGHLTLARASRGARLPGSGPMAFSASWEVDEVTLVASTLGSAGARYEVIGRYRLDGPLGAGW